MNLSTNHDILLNYNNYDIDIDIIEIEDANVSIPKTSFKFSALKTKDWKKFKSRNQISIITICNISDIQSSVNFEEFDKIVCSQVEKIDSLLKRKLKCDKPTPNDHHHFDKIILKLKKLLKKRTHLKSRLSRTITPSNSVIKSIKQLQNKIFNMDDISSNKQPIPLTNTQDLLPILQNCRVCLLEMIKSVKHQKRAFTKDEETFNSRIQFQCDPKNAIRSLFSTVENKTCPIDQDSLENYWGKESESNGHINTTFFPNNLYQTSEKISLSDLEKASSSITLIEVQKSIKNLKYKKAVGPDCIPNEFWKLDIPHLHNWLLCIFRMCQKFKNIPESC
jgi:hypothetical protein